MLCILIFVLFCYFETRLPFVKLREAYMRLQSLQRKDISVSFGVYFWPSFSLIFSRYAFVFECAAKDKCSKCCAFTCTTPFKKKILKTNDVEPDDTHILRYVCKREARMEIRRNAYRVSVGKCEVN